jgi:DNA polymerase
MLVGEQPGDREDIEGHPFVGPAGRMLDRLLEEASIPRSRVFLTNAVKHFKWEPRGKRRLHAKPNIGEANACRGWLDAEIGLVRPKVIVCLGAVAVQSFFGRTITVVKDRGKLLDGAPWCDHVVVTYHPSALLRRMKDEADYQARRAELVADLQLAASAAGRQQSTSLRRRAAHP